MVPLPHIAFKSHLAVDLELVHVELFAQQTLYRLNHARVAREFGKGFAVEVRGKVGAHRIPALLAHVVSLAPGIKFGYGLGQRTGFIGCEQAGEK